MSLVQMSFSGAVMVLAVIVIRALAINKLPKRIFVILWEAVLLRLLIPFSVPSMLSAYTLMRRSVPVQGALTATPVANVIPQTVEVPVIADTNAAQTALFNAAPRISPWPVLWIAGVTLCAIFFIVSYLRCYFEFRTSLPVRNETASQWLREHPLWRTIRIRQSDSISAPLTYGILRPVILMPKKTDWEDGQQLKYVLLHEYMHIRRLDMVWKLIAACALCIHWFNPMVWVMYILFNRDIELSCDERVVRQFGENSKSAYAMTLITMEEKKSGLTPLCNNFSKNAIEERITAVMKVKRITIWALLVSASVLVAVVVLFATTAAKEVESDTESKNKIAQGMDLPDTVLDSAIQWVEELYAAAADSGYSDWRIEDLSHVYTYEDFGGMTLQIYRMNYEFLADNPDNIVLAGGMSVDEEGWVVPAYPYSSFMVFNQEGEILFYLTRLVENDCLPGDETFDSDLRNLLWNYSTADLADLEPRGEVRADKTMVFYSLESATEEMPVALYVGDGFSIYIPEDDWNIYDESLDMPWLMVAAYSSYISIGVGHYTDEKVEDVIDQLLADDYTYDADSGKFQKFDGPSFEELLLLEQRLYGQDNDVWVVSSSFLANVEWGSRLDAIADTFAVTVDEEAGVPFEELPSDSQLSEDVRRLERMMTSFYTAYFQGDVDTIKQYLAEDYQWGLDVYEDPEHRDEVIIMGIKGLSQFGDQSNHQICNLSLEFQLPNEDSLTYLSVSFVKVNGYWKVSSYGLEK